MNVVSRDRLDFNVLSARIISNFKQVELSQEEYEKVTAIGHVNRRCALPSLFVAEY